jgi:acetate kinase
VREKICSDMAWCGLELDAAANTKVIGRDGRISEPHSALQVFVIHTDEEAIIARETARVISSQHG